MCEIEFERTMRLLRGKGVRDIVGFLPYNRMQGTAARPVFGLAATVKNGRGRQIPLGMLVKSMADDPRVDDLARYDRAYEDSDTAFLTIEKMSRKLGIEVGTDLRRRCREIRRRKPWNDDVFFHFAKVA